ncbi:ficolin-2-like [Physella acuta]|uniref:ficolin-2-like n=1 Tax=Physella acuta TaxID=109671 RepID=UPI0027DD2FB5|nr:ficolin-2-like [Physella acuta]
MDSKTQHDSCIGVGSDDPRHVVTLTSGLQVMCDTVTDGGGWTIFQRRVSGTVDFYRNWTEYRIGFGDFISGNFYLGNENIYLLTSSKQTELRVDMILNGTYNFAQYSNFSLNAESDAYRLNVDGFMGNATDVLTVQNGMQFSTNDRDNDRSSSNCAYLLHGGWWYDRCGTSNLNGDWNTTLLRWSKNLPIIYSEIKIRQTYT